MSTFTYTVKDKNNKISSGTMDGSSRDEVAKKLMEQGMSPLSIKANNDFSFLDKIKKFSTIPASDKVLFAEELSTLINAGVPIAQSLSILEKQTTNIRFKEAIGDIARSVEGGISFSNALERHPSIFSKLFVNMVRSGEIGGTLDEALNRLADQMNKDHELVAKIKGAMTYPVVIMVAMTGALIYLMVTIVPQLSEMFKDLGGELPISTKSLIFISHAFTQYWFITITITIAFVYGYMWLLKNVQTFRRSVHFVLLNFPVIGNLSKKINVARFARTLSSLLGSGVSVVESLEIVAEATPNLLFKEIYKKTAEKVKNGSTIGEVLKNQKIFPILVPQMISVGEETGSLDTILKKVADFYEREVDNITKNLSTLLEPVIMIVIGIMVGYVIISIITPIYSMTNMF